MKKVVFLMLLVCPLIINAQTALDDIGRMTIQAYVPETEDLPQEAAKLLQTKLSQIVTSNGIADNEYCERFVLTAKVNILTKDIVPGPPQRIAQKMEISLILGDMKEDKVYSTHTISTVGVGTNLNKAFIAAFKNIRPNNPQIIDFIRDGKEKVYAYYVAKCPLMLSEAKALAGQQKYEEALWVLSSIPNVCKDCYEESCSLSSTIYVKMINAYGATLLKQAQTAWAKQPNKQGAENAMKYISQINSAATCMPQVNELTDEITKKLISDEKREWEFKLEQFRASQKREAEERAYAQQRYAERQATNRAYISACRDVAVEYYRNRPRTVNYYTRIYAW